MTSVMMVYMTEERENGEQVREGEREKCEECREKRKGEKKEKCREKRNSFSLKF